MSIIFIATIAGLIAALGWGTADWLLGKSSKQFDKHSVNFAVQLAGGVITVPLLFFGHVAGPTLPQVLNLLVVGLCITAAFTLFIRALSSGAVGVIVPLSYVHPILTLVLSAIFIGIVFTVWQVVAMVGIVIGAVILAYEKNQRKVPLRELHRETLLVLLATVFWGFGFFMVNLIVKDVAWQMVLGLMSLVQFVMAAMLLYILQRSQTLTVLRKSLTNISALVAGVTYRVGTVGFYIGGHRAGSIIIPVVLSSTAPLVASFWGRVIDREKIGLNKRVGAVIVVAGIIILNVA
jgi:drug/metabolite transporter (DMT)-like permease